MPLQYDELVASQTANPATYGQQGQLTGGAGFTPGSNVITPEKMNTPAVVPFSQPAIPPVPDIAGLYATPPLTATPTETQATGLTSRLTALNDSLVGKSSYQQQRDSAFGVDTASKTLTDLGSRLKGIQNDAAAIPLLLEKNDSSQGVASPLIDRQRSSLIRDNAIEALSVSSLMSAAEGNLANAQALSNKAVAAKYGPIEAEINTVKDNLSIIMNSPEYSLEQKNRAQAQLDIQNQKAEQIAQKKTDTSTVNKIALDAAAAGVDAATLQKVQAAATPTEAQQIVTQARTAQAIAQNAKAKGVNTPFFTAEDGTVYRTSDGKAYTNPQEFMADGGNANFSNAPRVAGVIPSSTGSALSASETQIVTAGGRELLVNKITGETIKDLGGAYKTGSGSGPGSGPAPKKITAASLSEAFKTGWAAEGYIQGNGKISSGDYKDAKNAWRQQGFTGAAFDNAMDSLIDKSSKNWKQDYGYGA